MTNLFAGSSPSFQKHKRERTYLFPLTFSLILTFFLFFIDEGYYDLRWTQEPSNWLIFLCFAGGFYVGMAIIAFFTFPKTEGWLKKLIIMGLGLPLGILFIILFMYLIMLSKAGLEFLAN